MNNDNGNFIATRRARPKLLFKKIELTNLSDA